MIDKYDASGSVEGRFEPDSDNTVLANKLGIIDADEMTDIELTRLFEVQQDIFDEFDANEKITCKHLCLWHKTWLEEIYEWAGNYRSVNVSKDNFHFAVAHLIHKLMDKFENDYLSSFDPAKTSNEAELIEVLSVSHVEFILIHPFRDGNGRLGRLLMTTMALQAGQPILNFEKIEENRNAYFSAIQAGMDMNYEPMKEIISNVLQSSFETDD